MTMRMKHKSLNAFGSLALLALDGIEAINSSANENANTKHSSKSLLFQLNLMQIVALDSQDISNCNQTNNCHRH